MSVYLCVCVLTHWARVCHSLWVMLRFAWPSLSVPPNLLRPKPTASSFDCIWIRFWISVEFGFASCKLYYDCDKPSKPPINIAWAKFKAANLIAIEPISTWKGFFCLIKHNHFRMLTQHASTKTLYHYYEPTYQFETKSGPKICKANIIGLLGSLIDQNDVTILAWFRCSKYCCCYLLLFLSSQE